MNASLRRAPAALPLRMRRPGQRDQRRQRIGHFHAREVLDALRLSRIDTARLRLKFEMCGKGRPGSNASGVSTGKMISEKYRLRRQELLLVQLIES